MESPLIMHVTLALAAAFWALTSPSPNRATVQEGFRQKGEVMRRVEAHIGRANITNYVVGAVACLASVEVCHSKCGISCTLTPSLHAFLCSNPASCSSGGL
jgi:hypothetical protein